jgi:hypothetical protein
MIAGLVAGHGEAKPVMVHAGFLQATARPSVRILQKGAWMPDRPHNGRYKHATVCHLGQQSSPSNPVGHCPVGQRLYRTMGFAERLAKSRLAALGSRLRRRLVHRTVERQRDTHLYPRGKATQKGGQIRQASIQTPHPDRNCA